MAKRKPMSKLVKSGPMNDFQRKQMMEELKNPKPFITNKTRKVGKGPSNLTDQPIKATRIG
jgi:hypothetical protein